MAQEGDPAATAAPRPRTFREATADAWPIPLILLGPWLIAYVFKSDGDYLAKGFGGAIGSSLLGIVIGWWGSGRRANGFVLRAAVIATTVTALAIVGIFTF